MNVKTQKILNCQLAPSSLSLINQSRPRGSRCIPLSECQLALWTLKSPEFNCQPTKLLQGGGTARATLELKPVSSHESLGWLSKLLPILSLPLDSWTLEIAQGPAKSNSWADWWRASVQVTKRISLCGFCLNIHPVHTQDRQVWSIAPCISPAMQQGLVLLKQVWRRRDRERGGKPEGGVYTSYTQLLTLWVKTSCKEISGFWFFVAVFVFNANRAFKESNRQNQNLLAAPIHISLFNSTMALVLNTGCTRLSLYGSRECFLWHLSSESSVWWTCWVSVVHTNFFSVLAET